MKRAGAKCNAGAGLRSTCGAVSRAAGFTLLELVVTLVISSLIAAIAIPSFNSLIYNNRLAATANELVGALNQARLQAIKHNAPTQFCSNDSAKNSTDTLGTVCSGQSAGSVIYVDSGGATNVIQDAPQIPPTISITTGFDITAVRYNGNGLASNAVAQGTVYSGLVVDVSTDKVSTDNHHCIYMTTGSILSSCRMTLSTGNCPANEPASCQQQQ